MGAQVELPHPAARGGETPFEGHQVVLGVGVLEVGEQLGALVGEVKPVPSRVQTYIVLACRSTPQ